MRKPYNFDLTLEQREFLEREAVRKGTLQTALIDLFQEDLNSRYLRRELWQIAANFPEEFRLKKFFVDMYEPKAKQGELPTENDFQEFAQNIKSRNFEELEVAGQCDVLLLL
ncbi:MAG: hypothetical protein MJ157_04860, partial [Clostridia bacterium]|nr:hypothetical protein [Clostridia bacterium]